MYIRYLNIKAIVNTNLWYDFTYNLHGNTISVSTGMERICINDGLIIYSVDSKKKYTCMYVGSFQAYFIDLSEESFPLWQSLNDIFSQIIRRIDP